jgi:hypothetical protein
MSRGAAKKLVLWSALTTLRTDTLIGASEMRAFLIAWALLAVIVTAPILALQFPYLQRIERIRENPATTTGVFTGKNCANHASRSYAFEVDGKAYGGGGSSEAGGDCRYVQIGAQIVVHYEMGNPANNSGGDLVAVPVNWRNSRPDFPSHSSCAVLCRALAV